MNAETKRITERIRKLLRLSRSPNPHEAAAALERALQLAQANSISLATVDPDADSGGIGHVKHDEPRLHYEKRRALLLVQRHFNVKIVLTYLSVTFIGRDQDVCIAEYAYIYLVRSCRACMRTWARDEKAARRQVTANKRQNFIVGFMHAVDAKLERLRIQPDANPDTCAVIHATRAMENRRRDAYAATVFERLKETTTKGPDRWNRSTMGAGYAAGMRTDVRRPVAAGEDDLRLKLAATT